MPIVYRHRRLDTNDIFYIGIGKDKYRATSKTCRNKYWYNIVNKTDYSVEILYNNVSWDEAKDLEMLLIKLYGRKYLNTGTLCNLTEGGDGRLGFKHSEKTKRKMKKSANGFCEKAKENCLNSVRRKVIDVNTGKIFSSVKEVVENSKYSASTIFRYLNGKTKNKTNFKYLENDYTRVQK